ncbi:hypothetical protein [Jannaschia sp. R86511]|uniref:hypothetical protein n=1 Tax=Jannaschia sp. R86511 TaxID=3093853 RepID=UPI0036D3E1AD
MDQQTARVGTGTDRARPGVAIGVGVGVAAALLGLLPWLVAGARLPLQNLWAEPTGPKDMPRALLPFSQYTLTLLLALVVTGYGAAGTALRALGVHRDRTTVRSAGAALLAVHLLATVQTAGVVGTGLTGRTASGLYLAALLVVTILSVLVGLLVLALLVARSRAAAVVGLTLLAVVLASWLGQLLVPWGSVPDDDRVRLLTAVARWAPAVLVGAAIAWGGLRSRAGLAAAAGGLVVLWAVPAAVTAVTSAAGSRALLRQPLELLSYASEVLRAALLLPEVVLPPLVLAVLVALLGAAAASVLARGRRVRPA